MPIPRMGTRSPGLGRGFSVSLAASGDGRPSYQRAATVKRTDRAGVPSRGSWTRTQASDALASRAGSPRQRPLVAPAPQPGEHEAVPAIPIQRRVAELLDARRDHVPEWTAFLQRLRAERAEIGVRQVQLGTRSMRHDPFDLEAL